MASQLEIGTYNDYVAIASTVQYRLPHTPHNNNVRVHSTTRARALIFFCHFHVQADRDTLRILSKKVFAFILRFSLCGGLGASVDKAGSWS